MDMDKYMDIAQVLQEYIEQLIKITWSDDRCKPEFWVSINNEDENDQSIMLTINHCGCIFTEKIFPRNNTKYGYASLLDQMVNMYNLTV